MFHVILVEPEIPPNTGNVIRLCANTGAQLHLVEPLGFPIDHARMRRAGLDYHELMNLHVHADWTALIARLRPDMRRVFAIETSGAERPDQQHFRPGDCFVFGSETRGIPATIMDRIDPDRRLRLPMRPGNRSLNLSNSVAVVVFEAWRQQGFAGGC